MPSIKKLLVANRGEIALRIMRTCREMGIKTVAIYSRPDETAPHVLFADESVFVGEAASSESYLVMDNVINAAKETGADAIHPGYGFLSENSKFARRCENEGIIFVGPKAKSIELMGDKTAARDLMNQAGVPCPPGTKDAMDDPEEALKVAKDVGFPVLVKAAAGGGGKGMRIVHSEKEFESSVKAAKSEAKNAFGDDRVYVEKYLEEPRHVEFQIMADSYGNYLHLYDRECSIQRRHQKVVEEAPCSALTDSMRKEMSEAAIAAAKACDYIGAGTIEFLIDKHQKFYFLEMNTRLQVEHPVTELITGTDLVELQIIVAEGKELPLKQDDIKMNGHAIECRVYAENPEENFMPSTGLLKRHRVPTGPGVRVDAGVEEGQMVTINYDPMISKLSVFGNDRHKAIQKMLRALSEYEISGCKTTIPFCEYVLNHDSFVSGKYDTHFVQDHFKPSLKNSSDNNDHLKALAAVLIRSHDNDRSNKGKPEEGVVSNDAATWWSMRRENK